MSKTFELLIKDHKKVKRIIEELLETNSMAKVKRQNLLQTLKEELQLHEKIEEEHVYPVLEDKKATHDLTLEAYQEHHVVDELLKQLENTDFKDEDWKAKLTVLQENLLHHIDEEEKELFIKADRTLTTKEQQSMATNIATAKNETE